MVREMLRTDRSGCEPDRRRGGRPERGKRRKRGPPLIRTATTWARRSREETAHPGRYARSAAERGGASGRHSGSRRRHPGILGSVRPALVPDEAIRRRRPSGAASSARNWQRCTAIIGRDRETFGSGARVQRAFQAMGLWNGLSLGSTAVGG